MADVSSKYTEWLVIARRILCVVLLCVVIDLCVQLKNDTNYQDIMVNDGANAYTVQTGTINIQEPDLPSVFHDPTKKEIHGLMRFLNNDKSLNLTQPTDITVCLLINI